MKRYFKAAMLVFSLIILSGCNESNDNTDVGKSEYVTAYSKDDYDFVKKDQGNSYRVDLTNKVELSKNTEIEVSSLELLTSDSDCKVLSQDGSSFVISTDSNKVCDYEYFINSKDSNTELVGKMSGISRVVVSENSEQAELTPFGYVAYQGQEASIDVEKELNKVGDFTDLDGYTLDSVVLSTNSNAQVQLDTENNIIEYTPAPDFLGSEPIMYSMKNANGDVLAGTVIATVADEVKSGIDIQDSVVINDPLAVSESTTVDLTPYVTNSDDDWQLIYVNTFDAMANLTYPDDLENKSFDFVADHVGDFYVNAVVTDHHGGFDVSLIRLSVQDPNSAATWSDINQGLNVFKAPLTLSEAQSQGIPFSSTNTDTVGSTVAEFNFSQASQVCQLVGRLPTEDELLSLYTNSKPIQQGWPIDVPYWTNDVNTVFNLATGVSKTSGNNFYYLTCIVEGGFEILPQESSTESILANGVDTARVVAELTLNGKPVEGESISASINADSSAQIENANAITDVDGKAYFSITDLKAETVNVTTSFGNSERSIDVDFVADPDTAVLSLEITKDNQPVDGGVNQAKATLIDANDNFVSNQTIQFSTNDPKAVVTSPDVNTDSLGVANADIAYSGAGLTESQSVILTASYTHNDNSMQQSQDMTYEVGNLSSFKEGGLNNKGQAIIVANVVSATNNPISSAKVYFQVVRGNCVLENQSTLTDALGNATNNVNNKGGDCRVKASFGVSNLWLYVYWDKYIQRQASAPISNDQVANACKNAGYMKVQSISHLTDWISGDGKDIANYNWKGESIQAGNIVCGSSLYPFVNKGLTGTYGKTRHCSTVNSDLPQIVSYYSENEPYSIPYDTVNNSFKTKYYICQIYGD